MSATDQLSAINEKLESLPERLAAVLNGPASPAASARSSAMDDEAGGRKAKTPRAWDATERLFGSLGQFAPAFGKAAGAMRKVDDLGRSAADWHEAVFGGKKESDGGQAQQPSVAKARQTTLGSGSLPSVMNRTQLTSGASGPAFNPLGGVAAGNVQIEGINELGRAMQELSAVMRQLKDAMDQLDPSPHEDGERAGGGDKALWQMSLPPSPDEGSSVAGIGGGFSQRGPLRPSQDVPSAEQAGKGEGGSSMEMAMLAARFYGS